MPVKKFRTSILIDDDVPPYDDWTYIKSRHLKPTNLLRSKVKELRERDEGAPTIEGLQNAVGKLQELMQKAFGFIDEKGLFQEWQAHQKSLNN